MNPTIARHSLVALLAVGVVTAALWPLLKGQFLFDDYANLKALGEYGPIRDLGGILRYLSSGIADPLGRPVAMATFLLDARDWPADPLPFLRSNLLLHLVNGALLATVLASLSYLAGFPSRLSWQAAILGAGFWAAHPLWVSTVGYVVQRHAMLATTFVLLGILAWLLALREFRNGNVRAGWLWAALVMPAFGTLAALSKGNGMLLPLLVLVIHLLLLRRPGQVEASERVAVAVLLVIPSVLLLAALLVNIHPEPVGRPWTTAERLLSQPRAISNYLFHLLIPRVDSVGLFADGFAVSRSLLSPATTVPAALFLLVLLVAPFLLRRHHPALATALAFYLAGHVIESTVLPLELYFEHRNYLPAALLGWPLALHLLSHPWFARTGRPIAILIFLVLGLITHQRATLWADAPKQAAVWAHLAPQSPRAQTWAAQHELAAGEMVSAQNRLRSALHQHPDNLMLALNHLDVTCARQQNIASSLNSAVQALSQSGPGEDVAYGWLRGKILGGSPVCPRLSELALQRLLEASALGSTGTPVAGSRQHRLEGMFALRQGACGRAAGSFSAAQELQRWSSEAYADTALLASHCGAEPALAYLEAYLSSNEPDARERFGMLRIHQWILAKQGYWNQELEGLRRTLRAELKRSNDSSVSQDEE